ncbi:MAG: molybdopterin-binding protein [Kofleriaceae bacterium]
MAVLLVTNAHTAADESTVKSIIDRLAGAGHVVVECEVLRDSPQLVRAVFLKWIADLNIDVVLAIAGVDTECTGTALAPLITKPLDGFSELVRMISFEEIGTGAMLVDVTAAQCSSTFVFVMPASGGAVRSALDKILLPQLDSRTVPRNLVSRMQRLRTASIPPELVPRPPVVAEPSSAVPVVITSEKTAIGVGAAQLRAPSAPIQIPHAPRPRPVTPGVVAIPPLLATPKPITDDERTTPVEAAPARPPRKTPVPSVSAIDASVMDESWSAPMPEEPAPVRKVVVVADTPQLAEPWIKPKHVVPPVEPAPVETKVKTPAAGIPSVPKTPPVGVPAAAEPIAKIALKSAAPKTPAVGTPLPSIKAVLVTSESQATASGEATATPVEPPAPTPRKRPPTDPPPLPLTARKRAPTDPPPPPKKIIVDDETLPIEDVTDLATPISEIRPRKPIVEPILPSQRIGGTRSTTEGAIFDGRELEADRRRRKRSKMPILIAFLAIVASAIVILLVVNFVGRRDGATSAAATPRPDPAPVVVPPPPPPPVIEIDAAETVIAQVDIDAAVEEPEPPPIDAAEPEPPKPPPKADTRKPPVIRTPPAVLQPPDPDPPRNPPVANGCDEVSCILEKYGRSCCARFKPAGTVKITPSGLPESLDKTMIRAGVDRVRPVIIRCGETTPSKGTVKVAVSVKPDGHVDGADVADSPDATLGACVAGAIKKTSFNRTQNGGTFTYPFVF